MFSQWYRTQRQSLHNHKFQLNKKIQFLFIFSLFYRLNTSIFFRVKFQALFVF